MIIKRRDAQALSEKWYFTGRPCKHGHIAKRQVSNKGCLECSKKAFAKWESKNLDARNAVKKEYRAANPERIAEIAKLSRIRNPLASKEKCRARYQAKKHEYIAANKKRKADQISLTPSWADLDAIKRIYKVASRITAVTGIPHHVDHCYPLRGKMVCGLHVEHNLRVITAAENMAKYNKCLS